MKHLIAGLAFAAASALPLMANAQETTLRLNSWLPPSHPIIKDMIMPWAADVEAATDGRVKVQLLDSPLGPPPAAFDLAETGAVDLSYSVNGYTPGRFTLTDLPELPFLTTNATASSVAYQRLHDAMLAEKGEYNGVKTLGVFNHGAGLMWTTSRDTSPLSSMEGAKMRVAGLVTNQFAEGMNMAPVQTPASQVYELLSNGVVDGVFFVPESIPFFRLSDIITKGVGAPGGIYNVSFFFVMNENSFNKLSPEDQAAIDALSGEAFARRAGAAWDAVDAAAYDVFAEKGIDVRIATEAEMGTLQAAAQPIYDRVRAAYEAKGVDFDAALAMFKTESAKVAAE